MVQRQSHAVSTTLQYWHEFRPQQNILPAQRPRLAESPIYSSRRITPASPPHPRRMQHRLLLLRARAPFKQHQRPPGANIDRLIRRRSAPAPSLHRRLPKHANPHISLETTPADACPP
jgi:hypothetical protein